MGGLISRLDVHSVKIQFLFSLNKLKTVSAGQIITGKKAIKMIKQVK